MSESLGLWIAVAAIPLGLALATAFTKVSVVLGALRIGLGAEALLAVPTIFALALLVTAVVMSPVMTELVRSVDAAGGIEVLALAESADWLVAAEPLVAFVREHADPGEVEFFGGLLSRGEGDLLVMVSAFVATELAEALAIAVVILVPFVLVDLLVAQTLVLVGLTNQSPTLVVLPLKLLLFLGAGGWDLVIGGLVEGYR